MDVPRSKAKVGVPGYSCTSLIKGRRDLLSMPECGTLYGGILECGTFYERGTYMHDLCMV